jgi:hypothetical protein
MLPHSNGSFAAMGLSSASAGALRSSPDCCGGEEENAEECALSSLALRTNSLKFFYCLFFDGWW